MALFRKKPIVIEAEQCTERTVIHTLEGDMTAEPGDWIITGVKREKYPCKPDIFAATYEPAEVPSPWRLIYSGRPPSGTGGRPGVRGQVTALEVPGIGCIVRVRSTTDDHVNESVCFVAGAEIKTDPTTGQLALAPNELSAFAVKQGRAALAQLGNDPELAEFLRKGS